MLPHRIVGDWPATTWHRNHGGKYEIDIGLAIERECARIAYLPAFAGRDASQIWYQERFAAQKRAQQTELAKLQQCWVAHGHLMNKEAP